MTNAEILRLGQLPITFFKKNGVVLEVKFGLIYFMIAIQKPLYWS